MPELWATDGSSHPSDASPGLRDGHLQYGIVIFPKIQQYKTSIVETNYVLINFFTTPTPKKSKASKNCLAISSHFDG
jgi:hypothetical protein